MVAGAGRSGQWSTKAESSDSDIAKSSSKQDPASDPEHSIKEGKAPAGPQQESKGAKQHRWSQAERSRETPALGEWSGSEARSRVADELVNQAVKVRW